MESMSMREERRSDGSRRVIVTADELFYVNHVVHDADHGAHDHNYLELAFVLSGTARHVTIDGHETCGRGDLLIIPTGCWHGYRALRKLELVNCLLSPAVLQNELSWLAADAVLGPALGLSLPGALLRPSRWRVSPARMQQIRPLLFDLLETRRRGAPRIEAMGLLLLLLAAVRKVMAAAVPPPLVPQRVHPSVARAMLLLQESLAQEWSLGRLAACLPLNPSYLVRLFRAQTGLPPMKYLDRLRAERAATLLFVSDMPIGSIGEQVGWGDPKLFARQFRQHFGQSATRYRAHLLAEEAGRKGARRQPVGRPR